MGRRVWRRRASVALLGFVVALPVAGSCAGSRRERELRGAEYRITNVEFVGVTRFKKKELLEYLDIGESSRFLFGDQYYFHEGALTRERARIVELYAAHGYFDARIVAVRHTVDEKRRRVNLTIVVDEGPPAKITSVEYRWPDGAPGGPENSRATKGAIEKAASLSKGDVFDEPAFEVAASALREALRAQGFAFATVEHGARVHRVRRTAEVTFTIQPGPFVRIGAIEITGLEGVPEKLVRNEIDGFPGQPFSPSRLEQIERSIYALDVFRVVSVQEAEEPGARGTVDLGVRVSERSPQSIKLGGGFGIEANRWEQRVVGLYTHRNLFGNLTRFDARVVAGYAELPAPWNIQAHGPIVRLEPRLRKKGLLEKRLVWTLAPSFELGIREGYQYLTPKTRAGVSRFFTRFVELEISHNLRYVDFFNVDPVLFRPENSILGLDFRDPYLLSFFEFALNLYLTDRLLQPQNGVVATVVYDVASRYLGSDFDYHKISPGLRGYWQAHERVQLAARVAFGFIVPFGRNPSAPIDLKYYLGGTNSVRGWGVRRLSPRIESCDDAGECRTIPIGGHTMITGNVELRTQIYGPLWAAAFVDMGDVQAGESTFIPRNWNYATGPGLRLDTPIGKFRLDFGVRLNETPASVGERRWAIHFGLGEAF